MSSTASHTIKQRKEANDVFITPRKLAKQHIEFINSNPTDKWLDPCRNNENGSYFSQFPEHGIEHDWCEILEGKSFFDYEATDIDIICCNPPYSILNKWFKKCIELNPRVISLLIGVGNLTARRIEMMEQAGYGISRLKMFKVWKWYGMSYFVTFEKEKSSILEIDRTVWREDTEN